MGLSTTPIIFSKNTPPIKSGFIHMVFFWLKDKSEASIKAFIKDTEEFISQIEEVDSYLIGTPADTTRPIIERSYTIGLIVEFKSKKEHDIYQDHPIHKKYAAAASERYDQIMIFDTVKN